MRSLPLLRMSCFSQSLAETLCTMLAMDDTIKADEIEVIMKDDNFC